MPNHKNPALYEVLEEAAELVKKGWCYGALAQNSSGGGEWPLSERATRFSLIGSLMLVASRYPGVKPLDDYIVRKIFQSDNPEKNFDCGTQGEAVTLLREMAAIARHGE